ncbi:MAG: transporter [Nitrospinaceae bacterium]
MNGSVRRPRLPKHWHGGKTLLGLLAGWLVGPGLAWSAPITLNTAMPVAENEFIFREQFVSWKFDENPTQRNREVFVAESLLGYGITRDFALFGVLPYLDQSLEQVQAGALRDRGASGLGDLALFGRYTVFRKDWRGRTFRLAPFLGVEIPTGEDDETDRFGRLPPSLQPGSGSADPFAGMVVTYSTLDFQMDGQVSYKGNTEANDFEFGDVARLDASLQYRLWPPSLKGRIHGFAYVVLESNFIYEDNNQTNGGEDPNSGGSSWFLLPGIQYVTRRWVIEAGVQIPVIQDLHGTALETDYTFRGGFRFNF